MISCFFIICLLIFPFHVFFIKYWKTFRNRGKYYDPTRQIWYSDPSRQIWYSDPTRQISYSDTWRQILSYNPKTVNIIFWYNYMSAMLFRSYTATLHFDPSRQIYIPILHGKYCLLMLIMANIIFRSNTTNITFWSFAAYITFWSRQISIFKSYTTHNMFWSYTANIVFWSYTASVIL